jgi:hypothetical protein
VPLVVAVTQAGVAEAALLDALERRTKLPRVALATAFVEQDALREVSSDVAESRCLLPLSVEREGVRRVLRLAMADPLDAEAIEEIESSSGCHVEPLLAPPSEIAPAVQKHYRGVTTKLIHRAGKHGRTAMPSSEEQVTQPHHRLEDEAAVELRLKALVSVLIDKGVITDDEYIEALKRLLQGE